LLLQAGVKTRPADSRADLCRSIAHQHAKVGIELIDALRLLVQSHLDAFQEADHLVDLPAEILVLEAPDVRPMAREIIGGVAAVPRGTAVVAAVSY
jgi:hypothetical protein